MLYITNPKTLLLSLLPTLALSQTPTSGGPSSYTPNSQDVGTHVIYSYAGTQIPSALINMTSQGIVGGIILFGDNITPSLPSQIASLQSAYASSPGANTKAPLLILTDQEGGEVKRLPGGPTLSEKDIGLSSSPSSAATTAGQQAASALAAYGCNGNLAPVLGVFRSPGDFLDQYERSYSNNSAIVAEAAAAFITAQQGAGKLATAKHFPGLGAALADQDTDVEPVTLNLTLQELHDIDEAPYVNAIAAGVRMVMPSWAVYPALDTLPSGLSSKWIGGELRGRLGFTGVTISDAIEAGALEAFGSDGARAVKASAAGMDIILAAAGDPTQGQGIVTALVQALQAGSLDAKAFAAASARIASLRQGI